MSVTEQGRPWPYDGAEGREAEDDSRPWSSGPSLVELDAYGDFAPERSDHDG
jgi:hypothetical protein